MPIPELSLAEVLTAQHRYLKARVRQDGETVYVDNTHGKTLESIGVGAVEPTVVGGWWQFGGDIVFKARVMSGCRCGGTQVL